MSEADIISQAAAFVAAGVSLLIVVAFVDAASTMLKGLDDRHDDDEPTVN